MTFHGVFPYLVTPLTSSAHVKTDVLGKLCDDSILTGIHGLAPLGSTGEFAYPDNAKKRTVVKNGWEASNRRVPAIAGVASTCTADAVAEAVEYRRVGVDG